MNTTMSVPMKAEDSEKCKTPGIVLSRGMRVEVRSDDEGFQGAWYVATILEPPTSRTENEGKFLVKYDNLLAEDGINPLTEYVSPSYIKPLPLYDDILRPFELCEVVDAFYNDGWWKGVVAGLRKRKNGNFKYRVVFENPPHQIEFWSWDLRAHLDWTDHKWVKPQNQSRMKGLDFVKGMTVEVNFPKGKRRHEWFPAVILEEVGFNSFWVNYSGQGNINESGRRTIVDSFHIRHAYLNLKETSLVSSRQGQSDDLVNNRERKTEVAVQLENASIVDNHIEEQIPCTNLCENPLNYSISSKIWKATRTARKRKAISSCPASGKKFKGEKSANLSFCTECQKNSTSLEQSNLASSILPKYLSNPVVGNHPSIESMSPISGKDAHEEEATMKVDTITSLGNSGAPQNSEFKGQQVSASGGDNKIKLVSTEMPTLLFASDCMTKESDMADKEIDCVVNSHPKSMVYQSHEGRSPENTQKQCNDVMDELKITRTESHGTDVEVNNEGVENEEMPFIKSSYIWKFVDSKEVFRLMPQKPHFRPLMKCKEVSREGFAIGLMMMFATVVEKTSNLQVTDQRDKFDDYLVTLADLELHGFNVKPVMDRLDVLLSIKDELKQLEDQAKEVQLQIVELTSEKVKLETNINAIDMVRCELEKERRLYILLAEMNN